MTKPGRNGAKVQSFAEANPRDLLLKVVEGHPRENSDKWFLRVQGDLLKPANADALAAVIEYWFVNNLRAIQYQAAGPIDLAERRKLRQERGQQITAELTGAVVTAIAKRAPIVLMELPMPNGKRLADCTARDLRRFGGWFLGLADRLKGEEVVSEILTERDLAAAFKRA